MTENFELTIKRAKGMRSMRLKIGRDGKPVLTLPYWVPKKMGLIWAQKQKEWIQKNSFTPTRFYSGQVFLFLGQEITLRHTDKHQQTHLSDRTLWVSGDEHFLPRRTTDFIKKEFLCYLRPKIDEKEKKLGVKHTRLTLRDTSSRWGSCSSNGTLSFCWRLAMTPEFVIDYLIAHEVTHLKYMDHSKIFWKAVSELTPYTYQAKKWLKENGQNLPIGK